MSPRTKAILEAGVRDYIAIGEPITSERLFHLCDFGIRPAMIRWELNALSYAGYLLQKHTSSGRIPTNKAYRFFAQELVAKEATNSRLSDKMEKLVRELRRGEIESFIRGLAQDFGLLGVCYEPDEDNFWESGLADLLKNLDIEAKTDLLSVVNDFELLPERLSEERNWLRGNNFWPQIFVGENPITKSEHLSVLASRIDLNGEEFVLMTIGPKRMDYQKPIKLFKYLNKAKK